MSATKDLFGGPNETACPTCNTIHKTPEKARECNEKHARDARRDQARAFARGGPSRRKAETA